MAAKTYQDVLDFWIGDADKSSVAAKEMGKLWWKKSFQTDTLIAENFLDTLTSLSCGEVYDWLEAGIKGRLAAIIVFDQFPRNIFREMPSAFEHDANALHLTKEGMHDPEFQTLSEVEAWFFLMPLEHSENLEDQALCLQAFDELLHRSRLEFRDIIEDAKRFAIKHYDIVAEFGRFPHRNAILGRTSSDAELNFLKQPGSRF